MNKIYVIGAGGVGSWLTPAMVCSAVTPATWWSSTETSWRRRTSTGSCTARRSSGVTRRMHWPGSTDCGFVTNSTPTDRLTVDRGDWLLCAADNNLARKAALMTADETGAQVIIGCNEKYSSEAYYYRRDWKGKENDPRSYYPEIETDKSDDPAVQPSGALEKSRNKTCSW